MTGRLTLNLGFRWDLNTPVFEEQNRINYGFDTQVINPVSARFNQQRFPGIAAGFMRCDESCGFSALGQASRPKPGVSCGNRIAI